MAHIVAPSGLRSWADVENAIADVVRQVNTAIDSSALPAYTVATLPRAVTPNIVVVATDASSGRTLCLSDGTDWIDMQTGIAVTT